MNCLKLLYFVLIYKHYHHFLLITLFTKNPYPIFVRGKHNAPASANTILPVIICINRTTINFLDCNRKTLSYVNETASLGNYENGNELMETGSAD